MSGIFLEGVRNVPRISSEKTQDFIDRMNATPEKAFEVIFSSAEDAERIAKKFFKRCEFSHKAEAIVVHRIVSLLFQEKLNAKKAATWFDNFDEVEVLSVYEGWARDDNWPEGVVET